MQLYVIMGNDFPAGVMDDPHDADALCKARMAAQREGLKPWESPRVYWRFYAFVLNAVEA